MSRTRGHGNTFVAGHEAACRQYINSKQASKLFIVCFAQRRLNTSYSKRLWWARSSHALGSGYIVASEKWEWQVRAQDYNNLKWAESTIEVEHVPQTPNRPSTLLGRAYSDGSLSIDDRLLRSMPRRAHRSEVRAYLDANYTIGPSASNCTMYVPKSHPEPTPPVITDVSVDDSWTNIMNRENAV